MSSRILATNAFWSLLSHVLHRGGMMMAAIFMARSLEPQGFAAYNYFQMTVAMLATYAAMGLGVTASKYFAEFGHERGENPPPLGTLLSISAIMAAIAFCIVLLIPSEWLSAGLSVPHWLIGLGVAVAVAGIVPGGGILGLEKYRQACLVSLFSAIVMLSMTWLAVLHHSQVFGMWGIIAGLSVQCFGQMLIIFRTIGWQTIHATCRWRWRDMRNLAGFAGPMFLVSILAGSSTWIVGRMILVESGEREFAAYSIGLQWFALGLLLPGIVSRVILPRLVRTREGDTRRLVRIGAAMALAPAMLMAAMGLILAASLIRLYGSEYGGFAFVIPAFLAIAALSAPVNSIGNAIVARNGQLAWLLMSLVSFFALVLVLIIVPAANASWACVAHLISTVLMLFLAGLHGNRKGLV